ncbi:hypothetical protein B0H14DRAFT_2868666, partial [Mycena olivaceomarginata]
MSDRDMNMTFARTRRLRGHERRERTHGSDRGRVVWLLFGLSSVSRTGGGGGGVRETVRRQILVNWRVPLRVDLHRGDLIVPFFSLFLLCDLRARQRLPPKVRGASAQRDAARRRHLEWFAFARMFWWEMVVVAGVLVGDAGLADRRCASGGRSALRLWNDV